MPKRGNEASDRDDGRSPATHGHARMDARGRAVETPERAKSLVPTLSLPKGGGAIRGIGEKYEANNATGTGSLSVPVATSPGRGDFDLSLAVSYASGSGNGPFGLGWTLSVPNIARKTDKGLPRYQADSDVFILSGAEDLVPLREMGGFDVDDRTEAGTSYRVQRFRPRVEGTFARIERWTDRVGGDTHWRATTADNVSSIYGRSGAARIADPEDPTRVFSWLLQETRDDRGNIVRYSYKSEDGAGVSAGSVSEQSRFDTSVSMSSFRATAQRYLKRIEYGNREPGDDTAFHFEVVFDYGEHDVQAPVPDEARPWTLRADPFSSYRAGFEVRTYRLCRRVLMFHRFVELGPAPQLVRSTDFGYREEPALSYLESITHAGYEGDEGGGYERQALPSLQCHYIRAELDDHVASIAPDSLEGIPGGIDGLRSQWVDLDGEGIPGVLTATQGAWFYKSNLGGAQFALPVRQETIPRPAEIAGVLQQFTDLDGDGNLDLVQYSAPLPGYFERVPPRADRPGDWRPFTTLRDLPRIDWNDQNLRFIDLDGDGRPDVLITEDDAFVWYRSRAKNGFAPAQRVRKPEDERHGPAIVFADGTETIQLADMSGDGLVDIVRVRCGQVCYWPNLGHGRFGRKVTVARSPRFDAPDQFDPRRLRFADVDGSGTADIIYLGPSAISVFMNESGNSLAAGFAIESLPPTSTGAHIAVVDLLGQGTACLVWSSSLPGDHSRPLVYVDLMGGRKPHLLSRIENNMGSETLISYASSTKFYLQDRAAGRPWITRLPFPVQVIERIERRDHVAKTKLVSTHRYRHGYYDGHEREFRGFACVETLDSEAFSGADDDLTLPPVVTKTWYHTGAWLEREQIERELAKEYYTGDPEAPLLPDTILPPGLSITEEREAARALRGQVLRHEIYAQDASAASAVPYAVSEQSYETRLIQHTSGTDHAVFFVHPRESVTLHYERNRVDPRIAHELVLEVDEFGNATRSAAIGYPRRQAAEPEQARLWALVTRATVVNEANIAGPYHLGVGIETESSELTGLVAGPSGVLPIDTVRAAVSSAAVIPFESESGGGLELRVVERARVFYYRDDLSDRLPLGQIGARAIPYETLRLAFTPGLVSAAFGDRIDDAALRDDGRYVRDEDGWWAPSGRMIHDADQFFLPVAAVDPFGNTRRLRYDDHHLLAVETEDALGNRSTAASDYRVLAPAMLTDPNGNRKAAAFDALGMVIASAVMGKASAGEGDTLAEPTVRVTYDLSRWENDRGPAVVKTEHREVHADPSARWQTSYTYVDGSGREVMTKARAEPGPVPIMGEDHRLVRNADGTPATRDIGERWIGTGRTVFDNKGNPIKKYEPFFSDTFAYEDESELVERGVTPILRYDPLGRLIRIDHPDGTHERIELDAWQQRSFDANDTVVGTPWLAARLAGSAAEQRAAGLSTANAATPAIAHFDSLGRAFLTELDDGSRTLATRAVLDIEGLTRQVTDARGIETLAQTFDVMGRPVTSTSPDAGRVRVLTDVGGRPVRAFTGRDHTLRYRYDELQRQTHLFVLGTGATEILAQRTVYGEAHPQAADRNLRGAPYLVYDGAGVLESLAIDFKGNLLGGRRRLARDYKTSPDWSPIAELSDPAAIEAAAEPLVEDELLDTAATYDALDRITTRTTPDGSVVMPTYNEAGGLVTVAARVRGAPTATLFVRSIEYNARGQRTRIEHGNGAVCVYDYDAETFRLARQLLERLGADPVLQDLTYTYDSVGNVVQISDRAPFGNASVSADHLYEHDGHGRLVRAEGREHPGQQPSDVEPQLLRLDAPGDLQALRRYRQQYEYDEVGNILSMTHQPLAPGPGGWTRSYEHAVDSNRLLGTSAQADPPGQHSARYSYDTAGNMVTMPHLHRMQWDHANRLQTTSRQVVNAGTPETTYYAYDAAGERIRKVTERQAAANQTPTRKQQRLYLGGIEILRAYQADGATLTLERESLHIMDDEHRVALVETRTYDATVPDAVFEPVSRVRYQAANQVGSTTLELDETARVISFEEYFPFGATAMHAGLTSTEVSRRRYRYTGQERDTETGLHYHGARYYAAWLGRWTSADPAGFVDAHNRFLYARDNPVIFVDLPGTNPRKAREVRAATEDIHNLAFQHELKMAEHEGLVNEVAARELAQEAAWDEVVRLETGDQTNWDKKKTKLAATEAKLEALNTKMEDMEKRLRKAKQTGLKLDIDVEHVDDKARVAARDKVVNDRFKKRKLNTGTEPRDAPGTKKGGGGVAGKGGVPRGFGSKGPKAAIAAAAEAGAAAAAKGFAVYDIASAKDHDDTVIPILLYFLPAEVSLAVFSAVFTYTVLTQGGLVTGGCADPAIGKTPLCQVNVDPNAPETWRSRVIPGVTTGYEVKASGTVLYH